MNRTAAIRFASSEDLGVLYNSLVELFKEQQANLEGQALSVDYFSLQWSQ